MNLHLSSEIASNYKSPSQKIRILTESWVNSEIYCPSCGLNIRKYENNRPVADFYCLACKEEFELKSKKNQVGSKILDGAYQTALQRLKSDTNPNLFLLNYAHHNLSVINFFVVPKHFFTPEILERRKPLSEDARRAGWVGCNIVFQKIPQTGRIFYIKNRQIEKRETVLKSWNKTLFLRDEKESTAKGWILDVMNCIDMIGKRDFSLNDVYRFEDYLQQKHPLNKHVKDKIRQQLQFLRDKGYLKFIKAGRYELI